MAIQTKEWNELVEEINSLPQSYREVAAKAFRMGHHEGWWLAREDPGSTISPPAHEKTINPFNKPVITAAAEPAETAVNALEE